jgi:predicted O-methyltransferase YrrM
MVAAASAARGRARLALSLRVLPRRVARFYWRARRQAERGGDDFSLASAARPAELAELLALAGHRRAIVELGTGTAWSAIALALADGRRRVISYDPCVRPERDAYLRLAGESVRERIDLRPEPDSRGPHAGDAPVQLLFIDSLHEREAVLAAFGAWRHSLAAGAVVVFHDYGHPDYPGVREAVLELGLAGTESGGVFVWRAV